MTNLYKIASSLKLKGFNKAAQKVLDLAQKRKERDRAKDENQRVIRDMKEQDRLRSIQEQHQSDKALLQDPEATSETFPPSTTIGRKYAVQIQYPSWDENGAPYFDDHSVSEYLTMTEDDLLNYQKQEQQGGVKITSVKPLLPKSTRR
jgi:hypothetical protein